MALVVAACSCNAPAASKPAPTATVPSAQTATLHPADVALVELADAFERKDAEAVRARLSDAWSGSRFWSGWSTEQWHGAAVALRGATLKSATDDERAYLLTDDGRPKQIVVSLRNGAWKLDYNSFKGPFPHE